MHCMLMDLLHGFEVLSTTEETSLNSRNVSRLVQNIPENSFKRILTSFLGLNNSKFVFSKRSTNSKFYPLPTKLFWILFCVQNRVFF